MQNLVEDLIWVVFFLVKAVIIFSLFGVFSCEKQSCLLSLITVVSFLHNTLYFFGLSVKIYSSLSIFLGFSWFWCWGILGTSFVISFKVV